MVHRHFLPILTLSLFAVISEALMIIIPGRFNDFFRDLKAEDESSVKLSKLFGKKINIVFIALALLEVIDFFYLFFCGFIRFQIYAVILFVIWQAEEYLRIIKGVNVRVIRSTLCLILFIDIIRSIIRVLST